MCSIDQCEYFGQEQQEKIFESSHVKRFNRRLFKNKQGCRVFAVRLINKEGIKVNRYMTTFRKF